MPPLLKRLVPFFIFGMVLAVVFFGIILLAHLFFIGAVIGLILFIVGFIRQKFFPPKQPVSPTAKSGRIIDVNDWKEL